MANKHSNRGLKCVVIGDGEVGKTCLLSVYSSGRFPSGYVPTVFDNFAHEVVINGSVFGASLWDTAGQDEYSSLRKTAYPGVGLRGLCTMGEGVNF